MRALVLLVACAAPPAPPVASHVAPPPIDAAIAEDPEAVLASLRADLDAAAHDCTQREAVAARYVPKIRTLARTARQLPPPREAALRKQAGNLAMGYASHSQDCTGKSTVAIDAMVDALADLTE